MEIIGFILAFVIGITLGLVGAGGSILTITVLVYILGIPPIMATTYSLFIVGVTSLVGSIDYFRKGLVDLKKGLFFFVSCLYYGVFDAKIRYAVYSKSCLSVS
jgi:uncharacterized protein